MNINELRNKVAKFEKLDRDALSDLRRNNKFPTYEKYIKILDAKNEVKRLIANVVITKIHDSTLSRKLKNIRDNKGYFVDNITNVLEKTSGKKISQEFLNDGFDWIDALFSEGTADYVDEGYYIRRLKVGALITGHSLPEQIRFHLCRLSETFSLGLHEATIIFARAVIESGVFEALKRRGDFKKDGDKVVDIGEYSLKNLMFRVKRFLKDQKIYDDAWSVIKLANKILHSKKKKEIVTETKALDAIKSTFNLLEDLFE